jgi:PST family polysaccharide transporter/lipopolysaccharide exporter
LARKTGNAIFWRTLDLVFVKIVFLVRIFILARLLTPDDFGLLAIGVTVIGVLIAVSDFGMVAALVQKPEVTQKDLNVAWTIGVLRASAIVVVISIAAPWISSVFGDSRAVDIVRILVLGVLIDSLASIRIANLNRELDFRPLAVLRIAQALLNAVVAIALAPKLGVWSLVAGALAGSLAYTSASYLIAPHKPRLEWEKTSGSSLLQYGRWVFLTGIVVVVGAAVMRAVISRQLGVAELGIFFLAARIAFLAEGVIESIIGSIAFPLYARLQSRPDEARAAFRTAFVGTAVLLIPASLLLVAIAPGLVDYILGDRWAGTATIMQILALTSLVGLIGTSSVPLFKGFGVPSRITVLEIVQSTLCIALVWSLTKSFGLPGAAVAMLVSVGGSQILSIVFVRRILSRPYSGLGSIVLALSIASSLGAAASVQIASSIEGVAGFLISAAGGVVVALVAIYLFDRMFNLGLGRALVKPFPAIARFFKITESW